MKTLTLLETIVQVEWFSQQNHSDRLPHADILAVTPTAAYACQKLGLPYLKLEDHAAVSQRLTEHASFLADYLEWEAWLDGWAQQAMPEFGSANFKPASAVTYTLQFLLGEIWATALSLREFLRATQPQQVACWPPRIDGVPSYLFPTVSAWPALLPGLARQCNLEVIDLSVQAPDLAPISTSVNRLPGWKGWQHWVKANLRQNPLIADWVQAGLAGLWPHLKPASSNQPHILFSGYGYDLSGLARELRRQGAHITVLPDILPPLRLMSASPSLPAAFWEALTQAGNQLLETPELWAPLEKWGVAPTPLWSAPLHFWWQHLVPELWMNYQRVQQQLRRRPFTALVTWDAGGNTLSGSTTTAAATAQIPTFIYQHGSTCGNDTPNWQSYLRHCDTFLIYGQGPVEELAQTCPSFLTSRAQVRPVGSTRLDLLRQQYRPQTAKKLRSRLQAGDTRPLILYIPTFFNSYGRSLISEQAALPDVSYFELQQAALKLWVEFPSVRLVYKDFPIIGDFNRVMPDFIQTQIPDAVVTTQRLTDLMWAVDGIVVDHVATALGEILLTCKPLVVHMPQPNLASPKAKVLLQKRAAVADTPAEFLSQIRAFLQQGSYPELENPNSEFLQAYSTHLNDGQSAKRAASIILQSKRQ